ncbi:MAG: hypothetical protein NZ580_06595, partial [Bacteroidia bacterium]|nr:hypothetical protein [Bacteroidia bacterium]
GGRAPPPRAGPHPPTSLIRPSSNSTSPQPKLSEVGSSRPSHLILFSFPWLLSSTFPKLP